MSSELLDFFVIEATEYVDRLDTLVTRAATAAPDSGALVGTARALRGAATMAQAVRVADLALALEQIGRALRDTSLGWSPGLHGALTGAVDDLRLMLRAVRSWSESDEQRAVVRVAELRRHVPMIQRTTPTPSSGTATPVFVALQASAIAGALEAFLRDPASAQALDEALSRVRTLRGIAGIGDMPPLADVADAIERAARGRMPDSPLSESESELFAAAAALMRRASEDLRSSGKPAVDAPEIERFARSVAARSGESAEPDRVVPITELFYADAGPHIVQRTSQPPHSPEERFRQEIISRAEHLRRLVADTRGAFDVATRDRAQRDLRGNLRHLETIAASFGEQAVSAFFGTAGRERDLFDSGFLDSLDTAALLLLSPANSAAEIGRRLLSLRRPRSLSTPPSPSPAYVSDRVASATPASMPSVPREGSGNAPNGLAEKVRPVRKSLPTPTGRELHDLLEDGLAGFQALAQVPLSEPANLDPDVVPIESLLYRGRAALERAIEVRDSIRAQGLSDEATLAELFDLLDLALAE